MNKKLILLLTVFILIVTTACSFGTNLARGIQFSTNSDEAVKTLSGSGNVVKEDRPVSDFDQVVLNGMGNMIIQQGDSESLTIQADDNILPTITTEVRNGVLMIGFDERIRLVGNAEITYYLSVKDLTGMEISGLGQATVPSLNTDSLRLDMSGSGNIKIDDLQASALTVSSSGLGSFTAAGEVDSLSLIFSGAGIFDAKNLQSSTASVNINGTGTATMWVTDQLDVNISGGGFVSYYGDPKVTKSISGLGRVEKAGSK